MIVVLTLFDCIGGLLGGLFFSLSFFTYFSRLGTIYGLKNRQMLCPRVTFYALSDVDIKNKHFLKKIIVFDDFRCSSYTFLVNMNILSF